MGDINAIYKEDNLTWHNVRQRLIEYYSNVQYARDAMHAYSYLSQGDDETKTQYLVRAKVLLECVYHTTKLADIAGKQFGYLVPQAWTEGTIHQEKDHHGARDMEDNG